MSTRRRKTTSQPTKGDMEKMLKDLEAKLEKLTARLEPQAPEPAPAPEPEPAPKAESPRGSLPKGMEPPAPAPEPEPAPAPEPEPAPKAESPRGSLPKGMEPPAPAAPEPPKPQPAEAAAGNLVDALEHVYTNAAMTSFHDYRAKVTGYTPAPNRYFVRRTAPTGKVPTEPSWNEQKAKVTGYTQPSNQYFATRARLAYHPPDRTFGGYDLKTDGPAQQKSQAPPPPQQTEAPPPPPQQTEAPPPPPPQSGRSKKDDLAEYEKDYLRRLAEAKAQRASPPSPDAAAQEAARLAQEAAAAQEAARLAQQKAEEAAKALEQAKEAEAKAAEAKAAEAPARQRGTLPKGF